jgi:uncharacterized surface protein with fasciclin (FAS1) repeats
MKGSLPLALIVAHLILQSAVLNIIARSQQKPAAEEFRCGVGVTIAGCITGAAGQGKFITFAKLAKASGLEEVLKGPGPYTVFVPTDEAFSALPTKTIEELSAPANREQLRDILYLHAIRGNMLMRDISKLSGSGVTAVSLQGMWLGVAKEGKINGVSILKADIEASNGTIHIIDAVILPDRSRADTGLQPREEAPTAPVNQQTRLRVVKVNSGPDEPVKIVAVKLRGGEQIKPGVLFAAVDDWMRGLIVTVTNVSKKPVCFIHLQIHLPRPNDDPGAATNDALMFVCNPVNRPIPNPLMSQSSMDLVLTDSDYIAHEALLERNGYPPSVSDVELKVLEVEFFEARGRKH